jgi:hypothetical protein
MFSSSLPKYIYKNASFGQRNIVMTNMN